VRLIVCSTAIERQKIDELIATGNAEPDDDFVTIVRVIVAPPHRETGEPRTFGRSADDGPADLMRRLDRLGPKARPAVIWISAEP
jgi:hypothetical protein